MILVPRLLAVFKLDLVAGVYQALSEVPGSLPKRFNCGFVLVSSGRVTMKFLRLVYLGGVSSNELYLFGTTIQGNLERIAINRTYDGGRFSAGKGP